MSHLVGLRLQNWQRFRGEHEVELGPGIYALVATSREDPRRSNYFGKSSFMAAIRWLLFGSKVMDADALDDLVSHGEAEMLVEAEFSDGTFISRKRKRGKQQRDLVFEQGEVRASGDGAQELIERWVGIGEEELLTTAWSEQGDLARLVREKSTPLSATVRGWAGLERLERAGEYADEVFGKAAEELKAKLHELNRFETAGSAELVGACEEAVARERDVFMLAGSKHDEAVAARDGWHAWKRHAELLVVERVATERRDRLKSILGGLVTWNPDVIEEARRTHSEKARTLALADAESSRAKRLIATKFEGACPVSAGFRCPATVEINDRSKENWDAAEVASRARGKAANEEREAAAVVEQFRSGEERRRIAESELATAEVALKRATEMAFHTKPNTGSKSNVEPPQPLPLSRTELELAERALKAARQASAALPQARADVERARLALAAAKAASRVLGPEGALRRASEDAVSRVAGEANRVLAESGVELSVSVAWSRETGKPAEHCGECGLAFPASARVKQCAGCGRERGMKARHDFRFRPSDRSGAADDLAGLGLRCGVARYLAATRECGLSLAMFDEPLAQADLVHRLAVGNHMHRMLGGAFEQVIVSSHDQGFLDGIPKKIVVVADGRWSSLRIM